MIRNPAPPFQSPEIRRATSYASSRRGRQRPTAIGFFQPVPRWLLAGSMVMVMVGLLTVYPLLTAFCAVTLPICASLLLFRGESPILFACCAMQWLQVTIALVYCDLYGVTMDSVFLAPEVDRAATYCLVGVLALAVGMRAALSSIERHEIVGNIVLCDASRWDMMRVFQLWIVSFFVGSLAELVGWHVPSLNQILLPLANIKWMLFFIVCYLSIARKTGYGKMFLVVAFEFIMGFMGPFSNFKEGLMMVLIVLITVHKGVNYRILSLAVPIFVIGVIASIFWSSIKQDYRSFVFSPAGSGNSKLATTMKRFNWLTDRVARMNETDFDNGVKSLIARVQYISLVGQTISHVPHFEPYAGGTLWLGAIKHVLTPRIIFRNKAVLDDSERARKYTGLRLAGREEGTSIGIGYVAESYADLGFPGMFVPIFLLGVFMGRMYQVALRNKHSALLGMAIGTAMLFSHVNMLETSNSKIVGGLTVLCLAYWAMNRVFGGDLIRWLCQRA